MSPKLKLMTVQQSIKYIVLHVLLFVVNPFLKTTKGDQ